MAIMIFGMRLSNPAHVVSMAQADIVPLMNLQEQRISNNAERYEWPNLRMEPVRNTPEYNDKAHDFISQISSDPRRVFAIDAPQLYTPEANLSGFPVPTTTAALTGAETQVAITFPQNITQANVDGFKKRFFTFSGHRKLYLLNRLGVSAGGRSGTMTFTPNAQAAVASGETINFINPKAQVALANGLPPTLETFADGPWHITIDLVELWIR